MDADVTFGAWLRRRRRMLDLTQKELARQVGCAVVTIRKFEADDRKPSKDLAEQLAVCLKLFPEEYDDFIAFARAEPYPAPHSSVAESEPAPAVTLPPLFEQAEASSEIEQPVFVARQAELAQLNRFLDAALAGRGRVAFVTGQAGSGKTALVQEFARQARQRQVDLVVAGGACNAYGGIGDPYLPFREVLELLTGDVESRRAAGTMNQLQARRLWQVMPHTVQTLVAVGPDLIDVFVSGRVLTARAAKAAPLGADWLADLKTLAVRKATEPVQTDLQQHNLFSQYTHVLQHLARRQPVLLLLDDLQWADAGSISLLFHLGRQLQGQQILIVGVYRPDDVALGRENERHPLESVIHEFQRIFGDIHVDLSRSQGGQFVEALLDSEPNRLGVEFKQMLHRLTKGHALFTVEMLRGMQACGDLVQDDAGYWIEGPNLDWDILPAQIEGVIAEHLSRLPPTLQETLKVAAVEGETFTVEVIAQVQNVEVRPLVRQLGGDLDQQHRLVKSVGRLALGPDEPQLSRYRFRHILFQRYLYSRLDKVERTHLHQAVGEALEQLYGEHTEQVAVQLAHHFTEASIGTKAIPYLFQAGDQARSLYAHQDAVGLYQQALVLLKAQKDYDRAARTLMKLGLTYHNAFDFQNARRAYDEGFALWQEASLAAPPVVPQQDLTIRLEWQDPSTVDPAKSADSYSGAVIEQLFSGLVKLTLEMDIVPDVAQSWEIAEGGRRYIFHLRDDVCWSDGIPVTAQDFEYAWKRTLDPKTGSLAAFFLYNIKGARDFHQGVLSDSNGIGVHALNATTLVIEMEEPTSYFLTLLDYSSTRPVPQHVVRAHGEAWTQMENIVTYGPFNLTAWEPNRAMILSRNPTYRGRFSGNVQQVELALRRSWSGGDLEMYEADNLDTLSLMRLPPEEMDRIRQRHADESIWVPILGTSYLGFDVSQPPFDDVRVRRAFAYAIDREALANVIVRGFCFPATGGFLPRGMSGHSPDIGLSYDPNQARRLLAEAGYPEGQGFPVIDVLTVNRGVRMATLEYLQAQWHQNLGVKIQCQAIEWSLVLDQMQSEPPPLHLLGHPAGYSDPDNFLGTNAIRQRAIGWQHKAYDELVMEAGRITDYEARMRLYQQADRILMEEAPIIPLLYGGWPLLVKPWVTKFPTSGVKWWGIWKDVIIEPSNFTKARTHRKALLQPEASEVEAGIQQPSSTSPRTLRFVWWEPSTLDPALAGDAHTGAILEQFYRGLVEESAEMDLIPAVAKSWEVLEDGRKYVFYLREDTRWSDGIPVTAYDFEYAWRRALNPVAGSPDARLLYDIKGAREYHQGKVLDPSHLGVHIINETTLVVELTQPASYFLHLMAQKLAFPVPRHVVEAHGRTWTAIENIVTNGPFRPTKWQHGQSMLLLRNADYRGPVTGNVDRVEVSFLRSRPASSTAIFEAYENNDLDVAFLELLEAERAQQQFPGECISAPHLWVKYIGFDVNRPPFNDVRVRRAFGLAIDKDQWANVFLKGNELPAADGFIPPGMPGHAAGIGLPYDPEQACRLLAETGYSNGQSFSTVEWLVRSGYEAAADYLQTQWRETLGIELAWQKVELAALVNRVRHHPPNLSLRGWSADYADPDSLLRVCLRQNFPDWHNAAFNSLIEKAGRVTNQQIRLKLYRQADQLLMEEAVLIPLTYVKKHLLVKPWVRKFPLPTLANWHWQDTIIKE